MPPFRVHPDPFEFTGERSLAFRLLFLLDLEAPLLLFEPRRIIPLEGDSLPPVQFQYPAGDIVQEVPVVCDGKDSPGVLGQVCLKPRH